MNRPKRKRPGALTLEEALENLKFSGSYPEGRPLTVQDFCNYSPPTLQYRVEYLQQSYVPPVTIEGIKEATLYFAPGADLVTGLVEVLNAAKESIFVQAYGFTSALIAETIKRAHHRGVNVQVILDRSNKTNRYSLATFLRDAGIQVWIDAEHAVSHNKVMVIDESTVITGSFNFTLAAERNAENMLVIRDERLDNWQRHRAHSE